MPCEFTVLASGSAANTSLLEVNGRGVLIDFGLGPRQIANRLAAGGASWARVQAALLTHTHTDHWSEPTLAHLRRLGIPLYCHPEHQGTLREASPAFGRLWEDGLVRGYEIGEEIEPSSGLRCRPFSVCHDSGLTCGFRLEAWADFFGPSCTLGYAADLGCWDMGEVSALANVDVLALEFNHDENLERTSGRSPQLVARVLSDRGHLSNAQAAALVREVLQHSEPGKLRHLVQLHLSRDCNRPHLARQAAAEALAEIAPGVRILTTEQDCPLPCVVAGFEETEFRRPRLLRRKTARVGYACGIVQAWLPGFE